MCFGRREQQYFSTEPVCFIQPLSLGACLVLLQQDTRSAGLLLQNCVCVCVFLLRNIPPTAMLVLSLTCLNNYLCFHPWFVCKKKKKKETGKLLKQLQSLVTQQFNLKLFLTGQILSHCSWVCFAVLLGNASWFSWDVREVWGSAISNSPSSPSFSYL